MKQNTDPWEYFEQTKYYEEPVEKEYYEDNILAVAKGEGEVTIFPPLESVVGEKVNGYRKRVLEASKANRERNIKKVDDAKDPSKSRKRLKGSTIPYSTKRGKSYS